MTTPAPAARPLDEASIAARLMARGVVSLADVVHKGLRIAPQARRNANFSVTDDSGRGWFVKYGEAAGVGSLAHEARAYRALEAAGHPGVPRLVDDDREAGLLVLSLVEDASTATQMALRGTLSSAASASLGRALARLHRLPVDGATWPRLPRPEVFSLAAPDIAMIGKVSATSLAVVRALQADGAVTAALAALGDAWRADTVVHFDMKLSNVLFPAARPDEARLIDFEYAGLGDPRWDVGSLFAAHLDLWLATMPLAGSTTADRYAALAEYPLPSAQAAAAASWEGYREAAARPLDLAECVRFAGARLVHTALEHAMDAPEMTNRIAALVQLGTNVATRPAEAARDLLGLAPQGRGR